MLDILLLIAIGAFIGWNLPQPYWAAWVQEKVQTWLKTKGN